MADLHIPKPCRENWEAMSPNERGRHCAVCDKTVVDLTRMRPVEGRRFLGKLREDLGAGAHVCVRGHADARGRLLAPSATRKLLTNGLAAVLAVTFAGCQGEGPTVGQRRAAPDPQTAQPVSRQAPVQQTAPLTPPPLCIQGDVVAAPVMKGEVAAQPAAPIPPPEPMQGRVVANPQPASVP